MLLGASLASIGKRKLGTKPNGVDTMPAFYHVNAKHPVAKFNLSNALAVVDMSRDKFYCTMGDLGCGKDYPSISEAIRGLVLDHGYTTIEFHAVKE